VQSIYSNKESFETSKARRVLEGFPSVSILGLRIAVDQRVPSTKFETSAVIISTTLSFQSSSVTDACPEDYAKILGQKNARGATKSRKKGF